RGKRLAATVAASVVLRVQIGTALAAASAFECDERRWFRQHAAATESPIKHLIVIIGENRTFDHIFGTYQPKRGQKIWNLLSAGIVQADGKPGANVDRARPLSVPPHATDFLSPNHNTPSPPLPPPPP